VLRACLDPSGLGPVRFSPTLQLDCTVLSPSPDCDRPDDGITGVKN